MRTGFLPVAGLLASLAVAPAAHAAPSSQVISDPAASSSAQVVAVGSDGTAIAAWLHTTGPLTAVVQEATRPPGRGWTAAVSVSSDTDVYPMTPAVAIDGRGDAIVAWAAMPPLGSSPLNAYTTKVQAVTRSAGGSFGVPADLSPATPTGQAGSAAGAPSVAMDAAGDATVVWWPYNDASPTVESATRPAGGSWGPMAPIGTPGPMNAAPVPKVVADAAGDTAVVWRDPLDTTSYQGPGTVDVALRAAGSAVWGAPVDLSNGTLATASDTIGSGVGIGIDGAGTARAVWDDTTAQHIETATLTRAGVTSAPEAVSETGTALSNPAVAVSPAGDVTVGWTDGDADPGGKIEVLEVTDRPAGGAWTSRVALSPAQGYVSTFALAAAPGDQAVAVWSDTVRFGHTPPYAPYTVRSARLGGAAGWSAAADLTAPADAASSPVVALSPTGDATTLWYAKDGNATTEIHALFTDVTPPAIVAAAPPAPPPDTTVTAPPPATPVTPVTAPIAPVLVPKAPVAKAPTATSVIVLPPAKACVSRRSLTLTLHVPTASTVRSVRVAVSTRKAKTYTGKRAHSKIVLAGLPRGRYTVTVTVTLSTSKRLTLTRSYRTCAAKHKKA